MTVRPGKLEEIDRLMVIYREGREIMLSCGDIHQWPEGHPNRGMIMEDLRLGRNWVIEEHGTIIGSFAFIPGTDPTYGYIKGSGWIDDTLPYCTIHRLASCHGVHGVAKTCFDWCWSQCHNLRVDTHEENVIMRHCIEKAGFQECGIINLLNGEPRVAYQKVEI